MMKFSKRQQDAGRPPLVRRKQVLTLALAIILSLSAIPSIAQEAAATPPISVDAMAKANAGDLEAQLYMADTCIKLNNGQAVDWYRKAAAQGSVRAENTLGELYFSGKFETDYTQAALWSRKAAEQGSAASQFRIGLLYERGNGVPQDFVQAREWFSKAFEHGFQGAARHIGQMYFNGQGSAKDSVSAINWYTKAAEGGDTASPMLLAGIYQRGQGVPRSYSDSYFWMDIGCTELPDPESQAKCHSQRDKTAKKLSQPELSEAQKRAAAWFVAHPPKPLDPSDIAASRDDHRHD
jgi:TPR repeat protein